MCQSFVRICDVKHGFLHTRMRFKSFCFISVSHFVFTALQDWSPISPLASVDWRFRSLFLADPKRSLPAPFGRLFSVLQWDPFTSGEPYQKKVPSEVRHIPDAVAQANPGLENRRELMKASKKTYLYLFKVELILIPLFSCILFFIR